MENLAKLTIDREQCIGCGKCVRTCPSGIFYLDEQKKAAHIEIKEFGWDGCWQQDTDIACAYFELLCSAHGLGAVMMSYLVDVLKLMPDLRNMLEIPENHYFGVMVGFGFPEISYTRGVQKKDELKVHRLRFT